ncbi:MAG TPA: glycosyltransferase, partial [Rhodospirillales bacterium]|nr:glycosyltransferase [Rhodospirillales bacterium]
MFGLMNENPSFPSISVVIPTLDRRYTLPRTLDSVLNQTLPPDEIIVVDNGSTDGTSSMLKTNYPDVICLQEVKRGVSAARNKGILCANGVWIALLDSDDTWHPSKLEEQLKANRNKPGHRLIHTDEQWYKRGKRVNQLMKHKKRGGYIFKDCLKLCCISPSSALIEKSLFQNIGQFDEDLPVCEDYDLWLRVSAQEP